MRQTEKESQCVFMCLAGDTHAIVEIENRWLSYNKLFSLSFKIGASVKPFCRQGICHTKATIILQQHTKLYLVMTSTVQDMIALQPSQVVYSEVHIS